MAYEIIYRCNSTNNKNVREGELKILRKYEDDLYFEFGENEMNVKKRYYNDVKTLEKDYNALLELKKKNVNSVESKKIFEKNSLSHDNSITETPKKSKIL